MRVHDAQPIIRPAGSGQELLLAGWGPVLFWLKPEQLNRLATPFAFAGVTAPAAKQARLENNPQHRVAAHRR
jgi:hypothetical protein